MKHGKIISTLISLFLVVAILACGVVIFAAASSDKGKIDVYLIGGQSNAVGYAEDVPEDAEADSRFTEGFDNVIYFGQHESTMMDDFTETKVKLVDKDIDRSGAEIGIASVLGNSDGMTAIIKCAYGSTKLYPERYNGAGAKKKTWTSPSYLAAHGIDADTEIGAMYTNFINTVTAGVEKLVEDGYTPVIKGMLWMQGESETNDAYADSEKTQPGATSAVMTAEYYTLLTTLLEDIKADVGAIVNQDLSDMPFGMSLVTPAAGSSSATNRMDYVNIVNAAMERLASEQDSCFTIDPSEAYNFGQHDTWHYKADTQLHIGQQFVAGVANKGLVTFNGAFAKMNSTLAGVGESVTVKFGAARGYDVDSVSVTMGGKTTAIELTAGLTYTFTMPEGDVTFNVTAYRRGDSAVITPFGTVPREYSNAENYPWVVFNKDKEFVGAALQYTKDVGALISDAGDGAYVLLRRDIDLSATGEVGIKDSFTQISGSITFDLGGHTVSWVEIGSSDAFIRLEPTLAGYSTSITLKNGQIKAGNDPIVRFSAISSRVPTEYKNGKYTNAAGGTFDCFDGAEADEIHNLSFVMKDVDVSWESTRGTYNVFISATDPAPKESENPDYPTFSANNELVFEDCTFDIGNSTTSAKTSYLFASSRCFCVDITVKGGTVKAGASAGSWNIGSIGAGSSVTMAENTNGDLTALVLPQNVYTVPSDTFVDGSGKSVKFLFDSHQGDNNIYTVDLSKISYTVDSQTVEATADDVATPYGNIPAAYANTTSYPWVVFDKNGALLKATDVFTTEAAGAAEDGAVLLLRRNFKYDATTSLGSTQPGGTNNLSKHDGNVKIDLGGYTITAGSGGKQDCVFRMQIYKPGVKTVITITNGKIITGADPLVRFSLTTAATGSASGSSYTNYLTESATNPHSMTVILDGLNIEAGSATKNLLSYSGSTSVSGSGIQAEGADNNLIVKNCNIELGNLTALTTFVYSSSKVPLKIQILGGVISAPAITGWESDAFANIGGKSSVKFGAGSNGEYTKYISHTYQVEESDGSGNVSTVDKYSAVPTKKFGDVNNASLTDLRFVKYLEDTEAKTRTYIMTTLVTEYGTIKDSYASIFDYPIVIFNASGTCVAGTGNFTKTAAQAACGAGDGAIIYIRADIDLSTQPAGANYLSTVDGTIIVDLGGHTVDIATAESSKRNAFIKLEACIPGYTTKIIVKNGSVLTGNQPVVRFAVSKNRVPTSYTNAAGEVVEFDYLNNTDPALIHNLFVELDGLNISFGENEGTYSVVYAFADTDAIAPSAANNKLTVKNCYLDFNDSPYEEKVYAFASHNKVPLQVEVIGSTLTYNDSAKFGWEALNSGNGSTLTFSKNEEGKYLEVILPENLAISKSISVSSGDKTYTYSLMKKSASDSKVTYTFRPKELTSIKVSTNTTLYSNFVFKAHVTALDSITSIELGGVVYSGAELEALREGDVFIVPVNVAAMDAMDTVTLKVNVSYAEDYSGAWNLGIVKYAEAALNDESLTETAKAVIEAMLSYVKAAYKYFNTTGNVTDEELAEANLTVNMLLGERYDLANTPGIKETAVTNTPTLTGASVTLGAELKFYFVTDGTYDANLYRFTANGRALEAVVNGNAIEVTTYAFALRDTITYTVDGTEVTGSYNLKSYYDYMAGEGNGSAELMNLLERLWWYSESAEVYKNSIAG